MGFGNMIGSLLSTTSGAMIDEVIGGGKLQKARLIPVARDAKEMGWAPTGPGVAFPINPESVTVRDHASPSRSENVGGTTQQKQGGGKEPREISFKAVFDTYEQRLDVRDVYIRDLQDLVRPARQLHIQPTLLFVWGNFSANTMHQFICDLEEFEVTYTMFLPDGSPVRCAVDIVLREVTDPNEVAKDNESPDHAKLHTVRRGDTLQNIAYREYDDPGEWRRIAAANGIDDPMALEPGTRLLVPPILR